MLIDQLFLEGSEIRVCHSDTLYNLNIVPTIFREAAVLIDSGNAFPAIFLKNTYGAVWFENDQDVVSFIVYEPNYIDNPVTHIHFSWVNPKFRGKGVRSLIQRYFEDICKQNKNYVISSQTFVHNKEVDRSYDKIGLRPLTYMRYKKLT